MAQLTQFKQAKEKIEQNTDEYKLKIKKYRIIRTSIIISLIVIILSVVLGIILYNKNKVYKDYEIIYSNDKNNSNASYTQFAKGYISYNNDGIEYITFENGSVWKQSYQMRNPKVAISGDYVAVADITSNQIYVFDVSGLKNILDTVFPITQIEIAKQGVVVAALEDETSNYVNMYGLDSEMIYSVKTTISGEGYPLDIDISDDGKKLVTSYAYMSGTALKSKIAFYNFSEVGKNEVERLVGTFNYESSLVPNVEFIGNDTVVAFSDNAVRIYDIEEYPSLKQEIAFNEEVKAVVSSEEYIGLVFLNNNQVNKYRLEVYDYSANLKQKHEYSTDYSTIEFVDEGILFYNDYQCKLINMKGKCRFDYKFDLKTQNIINISKNKYYLINTKYVQEIKLK